MGHATRIIPLIEFLLKKQNEIIIAADGPAFDLLKNRFPELTVELIEGYNIQYNPRNMALDMGMQLPKLIKGIRAEKRRTDELVKKHLIDVIISDNRYGVHSKLCKSYFITHQLKIQAPYFQRLLNSINHLFISKFDECWIPDFKKEPNLTGELTNINTSFKTRHIGPLSRFWNQDFESDVKHDCLILISGPEPKRSLFEKEILDSIKKSTFKNVGIISPKLFMEGYHSNSINVYPQIPDHEFYALINQSQLVITRPGYTTIMDLLYTNCNAFFIPTKGQTEQEYLANHYQNNGWSNTCTEEEFSWEIVHKNKLNFPKQDWKAELNIELNLENALREL